MAGAPIPVADCRDCPELTTSVATVGLCLADTTPIAVVVTRDCNGVVTEDGWIDLTSGTFTAGSPPVGTGACSGDTYDFALSGWLCDILPDGSVAGIALVQIERDSSGAVIGITLIGVNGLPYVPVGIMTRCPEDRLAAEVLCDAGNGNVPFVRFYTYAQSGTIPTRDTDLDGTPYVVVGPAVQCALSVVEPIDVVITGQPIEVTNPPGNPINIEGTVDIGNQFDDEYVLLCDSTPTQFIRRYRTNSAGVVSVANFTLAGGAFVPLGAVGVCSNTTTVTGTVTVAPLASQNVRTYRNNLVGIGVWSIAANGHGGKVKSVTFRRRAGGVAGSVTITDNFGTVTSLLAGESETWSITALDDEIISPFLVTTTDAANNIIINWTEAP